MSYSIKTEELTKRFETNTAVDHISLAVEKGEIFGLIGPNGAGKTTLIRLLTTLLQPTEGTAKVAGYDIRREPTKVRDNIGVVSQAMTLDVELTAWENMELHAKYFNIPKEIRRKRIKELLDVVGLGDKADYTVGSFSGGMKRKLEIIRSLIHRPQILFLDEPTTGLDPQARNAVWEYLRKIHKEENVTVMITTHYLDEAEVLCQRVAIIDYGEIIVLGTPLDLKRKVMGGDVVEAEFDNLTEEALSSLQSSDFVVEVRKKENGLTLIVKSGAEAVPRIVELVDDSGGRIHSITLRAPTLDDVFLQFTGRSLREDTAVRRRRFVSTWGATQR